MAKIWLMVLWQVSFPGSVRKNLLARVLVGCAFFLSSCSSPPIKTTPELSTLFGKKVALVSIDGNNYQKRVVESALVSQITRRKSFSLLSKRETQEVRNAYEHLPSDWIYAAAKTGADYALQMDILQYDAPIQEGNSLENHPNSTGQNGELTPPPVQPYKIKWMDGHVRIGLKFIRLKDLQIREGIAEAEERKEIRDDQSAIIPELEERLLEHLTNQAIISFLNTYEK